MIELNMKAKPFHPCESALGVELLLSLHSVKLVGSVHYKGMDAHQDIPKDILVWCPNGVRNIRTRLKAEGWVESVQHLSESLIMNGFGGYVKHEHKMFITPVNEYYTKFIGAQEICKMWYETIGDITKEQVGRIHDITMFGAVVDNQGQLQMPNMEEEDGENMGGAAQWAQAQPAVAPQPMHPGNPAPWGGGQVFHAANPAAVHINAGAAHAGPLDLNLDVLMGQFNVGG